MCFARIILLTWLFLFLEIQGFGSEAVSSSSGFQKKGAITENLTDIAGCLKYARSHSDQTTSLRVEACITLVDRENNLIILQDGSGAMGVYLPLTDSTLKPGQRVVIEGSGICSYERAFPAYPDQPSARIFLDSFEAPSGRGRYYLDRMRGFLHPPVSGQYTFWVAADDAGELCLSPDASPKKMQPIASNKIGNATRPHEWERYASQRSRPVTLIAGRTYYVEALHVQGYGTDCFAAAWEGLGIKRSVIDGRYLTPWVGSNDGDAPVSNLTVPSNGLLLECWTNFFASDYEVLRSQSENESVVRIRSLKLTVTGEKELPAPQQIKADMNLDAVSNLCRVELEGDVSFASETGGKLRLELKREDSSLEVNVLNWNGPPVERLVHSRVRIRGVLEHGYGSKGELISNVLWVPDGQEISLLDPANGQKQDLSPVAICEIEPSNPEMNWGRQVSVRGRIINRTTNGLVVVEGNDNYQAFCSVDGTNWVSLGDPVEIGMSNSVLAGLALDSHNNTGMAFGNFEYLQGFGTNWLGTNIGKHKPGSFSTRSGILTLNGSGRQIGERSDLCYYLYQPLDADVNISALVTLLPQAASRAQIGLMIRESLDPKAPYAAILFTPAHGAAFQYRLASNDLSSGFEADSKNLNFHWVKLTKRKSLLLVQGEPDAKLGAEQALQITGMITWQNNTPILTGAFFQAARENIPSSQPTNSEAQQSIADAVSKAEHPPEPFLYNRMPAWSLHGIVTFCGDFLGENVMFVQDGNDGGIQITWPDPKMKPAFEVGQLVEMHGYTSVHKFPVVFEPLGVDVTGWGTLPDPEPYSPMLVESDSGQARWVEATGVIRSVETNGLFNLMTKDGVLSVWVGQRQEVETNEYVDALVRLRGVLSMDSAHIAQLLVPSPEFVEIQERAPADLYAIPRFSIVQLAALDLKPERLRKMKLSGVVTCSLPNGFFVQDDTGGAYVQTGEPTKFRRGDRVEAVGFPDNKSAVMMILSGASARKTGEGDLPNPIRISIDKPARIKSAGMLVSLQGLLLEQRDTSKGQLLTLQIGTQFLEAERLADSAGQLPQIPIGSHVAITGVCQIDKTVANFGMPEAEATRPVVSLKIWLSDPAGVVLLQRPPWWTSKRVAWLGGIFATGFLVALARVRLLRRRVAERTRELQAAMQQLEKETRTSAILAERDRLAGEIHDTLEQGLTAVMLQLDAADKHADQSPEVRKFIHMARNMAEFSRSEIQHAVWDMQSPLLANADLGTALKHVASQISSGSPEVKIEIVGAPRALPSSHEHHLLRIAQEGITNALKHAQAQSINVVLDYSGADIKLTITDDGSGFVPGTVKVQDQIGHFGLHGIRARAKKIEAQLDVSSRIGKGTTIAVRLKLNHEPTGVASNERELL